MSRRGWVGRWTWGPGLLAVTALVLTACGDSGSVSRGASSVTGSTVASESADGLHSVEAAKKKNKGNKGKHKGRPEAEVQGVVANLTGTCPTITFTVGGVPVRANGVTEFEGTTFSCGTLANGNVVKVEGQPLGDGTILAREVKLLTTAPGAAAGAVTVSLVGPTTVSQTTDLNGKFEFEDTAPGSYDLQVTVGGTPCTLASGISLVAQKNEIEGKLATTSGTGCASLVLVKLEVKQGTSKD